MIRFLVFVSLLACYSCARKVPDDVLPPERMQEVMWDMMQADEVADYYLPTDSSYRRASKRQELYETIFRIHQITKKDFDRSYQYYLQNPKMLKAVFDSLQASGERRQYYRDTTIKKRIADTSFRKERMIQAQ